MLKGQCHEIFCFLFFSWTSFPPAPEYHIRTVLNFFENSRRYSQAKVHHRYQRHRWQIATGINDTGGKFATCINDTGGKPLAANISANFRTISKRPSWYTQGIGGNWFMTKTRSRKSRVTVPLNKPYIHYMDVKIMNKSAGGATGLTPL
jgi:hypothetical protein